MNVKLKSFLIRELAEILAPIMSLTSFRGVGQFAIFSFFVWVSVSGLHYVLSKLNTLWMTLTFWDWVAVVVVFLISGFVSAIFAFAKVVE